MFKIKHRITGRILTVTSLDTVMVENWIVLDNDEPKTNIPKTEKEVQTVEIKKAEPVKEDAPRKIFTIKNKNSGFTITTMSIKNFDLQFWEIMKIERIDGRLSLFDSQERKDVINKLKYKVKEHKKISGLIL